MKRFAILFGVVILLAAARVSAQTVEAQKFRLSTGPCVLSSGSGAPSAGNVCDLYFDIGTGDLWIRQPGQWVKVGEHGSGTPGTIAKWATNTTLTNSILTEAAGVATVNGGAVITGPASVTGNATLSSNVDVGHTLRVDSNPLTAPTSGAGVELFYDSGTAIGNVQAVDRTAGAFKPIRLNGNPLVLNDLTNQNVGIGTLSPSAFQLELTQDVGPHVGFSGNIGHLTQKWLSLHVAELWAETLVAQNTLATIGGRILVAPTNELTIDVQPADTGITTKYNNYSSTGGGDVIYCEANNSVEFMRILGGPSPGTGGGYFYTVARDLDGTGANAWPAGSACVDTGQPGSGFLDLYSLRGTKAANEAGPTMVGNVRTSTTFNGWSPRFAIGNLNGLYGYNTNTYGAAFGDNAAAWIKIDPTNGVRLGSGGSVFAQITPSGSASFTGVVTVQAGSNVPTTGYVDTGLANKINVTGAADDVNSGTTTITGLKITTGTLHADRIVADSEINIKPGGFIDMGQRSYNSGTGFFLGDSGGVPKFSIGSGCGSNGGVITGLMCMTYDGNVLSVGRVYLFEISQPGSGSLMTDLTISQLNCAICTGGPLVIYPGSVSSTGGYNINSYLGSHQSYGLYGGGPLGGMYIGGPTYSNGAVYSQVSGIGWAPLIYSDVTHWVTFLDRITDGAQPYVQMSTDAGAIGVYYFLSDERKKRNIVRVPEDDAAAKIRRMTFIAYNYRPGSGFNETIRHRVGWSGQELERLDPNFVTHLKDHGDPGAPEVKADPGDPKLGIPPRPAIPARPPRPPSDEDTLMPNLGDLLPYTMYALKQTILRTDDLEAHDRRTEALAARQEARIKALEAEVARLRRGGK